VWHKIGLEEAPEIKVELRQHFDRTCDPNGVALPNGLAQKPTGVGQSILHIGMKNNVRHGHQAFVSCESK
jgi:hypothetical protein